MKVTNGGYRVNNGVHVVVMVCFLVVVVGQGTSMTEGLVSAET